MSYAPYTKSSTVGRIYMLLREETGAVVTSLIPSAPPPGNPATDLLASGTESSEWHFYKVFALDLFYFIERGRICHVVALVACMSPYFNAFFPV